MIKTNTSPLVDLFYCAVVTLEESWIHFSALKGLIRSVIAPQQVLLYRLAYFRAPTYQDCDLAVYHANPFFRC